MAKYKILTPNDIIDIPENDNAGDFTIPNLKEKAGYNLGMIYSGPKNDWPQSRKVTNNSGFDLTWYDFSSYSPIKKTLKNGESVFLTTKQQQIGSSYRYFRDYIESKSNLENVYCAEIE